MDKKVQKKSPMMLQKEWDMFAEKRKLLSERIKKEEEEKKNEKPWDPMEDVAKFTQEILECEEKRRIGLE